MQNNDGGDMDPDQNMGGDYGDEDYNQDGQPQPGDENQDGDVDQYFDDAGDVGYLPADHVTSHANSFSSLLCLDFKMRLPSNLQMSTSE